MTSQITVYERIARDLTGLYQRASNSYCIMVLELRADAVLEAVSRLKDDFGFDQLLEVSAAVCPERRPPFEVEYHLYSSRHHKRLRLKIRVPEGRTTVPTFASWYSPAPFMEREVTERYGICFGNRQQIQLLKRAFRLSAPGRGERGEKLAM
ncbi:MAG: NADH-quinone oxidoreductase subunit C [Desulfuromonadales bacterium]|nr:NADH-quinone oxidoreductase subunit C [Desulfuromonadales bacterium]